MVTQNGIIHAAMKTVSIKITEEQLACLDAEARARGMSRSALMRRLLDETPTSTKHTLYDVMKPFIGAADGPEDLSTNKNHMAGYGDSRTDRHRSAAPRHALRQTVHAIRMVDSHA